MRDSPSVKDPQPPTVNLAIESAAKQSEKCTLRLSSRGVKLLGRDVWRGGVYIYIDQLTIINGTSYIIAM